MFYNLPISLLRVFPAPILPTMPGTGHRLQPVVLQAVLDRIAARDGDRAIYRATSVGRPTILKVERKGLQAYLEGYLGAYMDEMRDFLYDEYDVRISLSSVYRELEKMR
ncbi:hypothetical protein GQ44DRAFT_758565 [Phaeosphaeriaceae sp. PMI808]|nr:hypothetical protein GQ44DRAFT_758565 [Phaeosphaeriaceae sp. PMI808]